MGDTLDPHRELAEQTKEEHLLMIDMFSNQPTLEKFMD